MTFIAQKKKLLKGGLLYLVLDFEIARTLKRNVFSLVNRLVNTGIDMIQFRFKNSPDIEFLKISQKLVSLLEGTDIITIVNDRCDIAFLCNADGVHLGADDIDTKSARRIIGKRKIIGRTVHSETELNIFSREVDYVSIGPIFPTSTKSDLNPLGIDKFKMIAAQSKRPVFAIGGINTSNVSKLANAGIKNIAVCQGIIAHPQPVRAAKFLKKCLQELS